MKTLLQRAAARVGWRNTAQRDQQSTTIVRRLYTELMGREPDSAGLTFYVARLEAGHSPVDVAVELASSREAAVHAARRYDLYVDDRSDHDFITDLYRDVLGREADVPGREWLQSLIESGQSRQSIATMLATSEESLSRQLAQRTHIQDLRDLRPASFSRIIATNGTPIEVFHAASPEDFDWLESAILEHGFYEKPGIWSLAVDDDKRRMARLLSTFRPSRTLELGCSSGAVLHCLAGLGYVAEGLEISTMAIQRAHPDIRPRIHRGDLLDVELPGKYELVFGLDLFEHLNPNRFHRYLDRLAALVEPGGFVFVNSPAFGADPVWGELFPLYVESWEADAAAGRLFRDLHVDDDGYPQHGHLIWASSQWWTEQFERAGFRREIAIEHALHEVYDAELEREALGRKAFFVFSLDASPERVAAVLGNAELTPAVVPS